MNETIEITIKGKKYQITKGLTLETVAKELQTEYKYPILIARVNNVLKELNYKITTSCNIEFLDLTTREGSRVHIAGLTYVLVYAVKKLYGKSANIVVQHSLDKGIYIETSFKIDSNKILAIKNKMIELVKSNMSITKMTINRLEAIDYFTKINDIPKKEILRYNTNTYITLYRLGNYYNYFYNLMPISTGYVKDFDLTYIKDNGFVLRFPTVYLPNEIKEYTPHPMMFDIFQEYRDWAKIMNVQNIADLNKIISEGKINDLIKIDETLQSNKLLEVATTINSLKDKVKIILLAGPSSSGKTTTSRKLCMFLKSFGLNPKVLSMDDYFVERKDTPKDENGNYDYECLEAIDLKLFDDQLASLLNGEEVTIPTYNFITGEKAFVNKLKIGPKDIIVIEGIHALNNKVLTNIPREKKYKIYISALTELNIDDHNRISTTDNRLIRRMVRDNRTRGHSPEETLMRWPSVRRGEEKFIFPCQDEADYVINSALIYELGVLKIYAEPILYSIKKDSPYYEEAKRLLNFLRLFLPIPTDEITNDSIIREFIGNGYFHD